MTESKRAARIDYKRLHTTGERVLKEEDISEAFSKLVISTTDSEVAEMAETEAEESALSESIADFLEENPVVDVGDNLKDHDNLQAKVEALRTSYRVMHHKLKQSLKEDYKDRYEISCTQTLNNIKKYLVMLKEERKKLREVAVLEVQHSQNMRETKFAFLERELINSFAKLENVFNIDESEWKVESDADISRRKSQLSDKLMEFQAMPRTMKDLMDNGAGVKQASEKISTHEQRYERLVKLKNRYISNLEQQTKAHELEEFKDFNRVKLDIKLSKFSGYSSTTDIFTFQNDFEKFHKSVPPSLLCDLLKNNYLEGQALLCVKDVKEIQKIWERLKEMYGNVKMMLQRKLDELNGMEGLWKMKEPSKAVTGLSKLVNLMRDLMHLAKSHNIEERLFYGDGLEKIQRLMGDHRLRRWLTTTCDSTFSSEENRWNELILFLEKDIKVCQQLMITTSKGKQTTTDSSREKSKNTTSTTTHLTESNPLPCFICGAKDHVATHGPGGSKLVQYFACPKFTEMSPAQRFAELKAKNLCFQCLYPGAQKDQGKHKDGRCQRDFVCGNQSHERFAGYGKKHVLVCDEHKTEQRNKEIFEEYKRRCITRQNQVELPNHSKNLQLHHTFVCSKESNSSSVLTQSCEEKDEEAIYMLQAVGINGERYNVFYDTGCRQCVIKFEATRRLGPRAYQEHTGPVTIGGVAGLTTESQHGIYSVRMPLRNGKEALVGGVCMDSITETFPSYPLKEIELDIKSTYTQSGGDVKQLPPLAQEVGGDTDIMLGIQYNRYFPKFVFQMLSGLTIYESCFQGIDGSYGVIGGPHRIITQIERANYRQHGGNFISNQYLLFQILRGYQVNPDLRLLGYKGDEKCDVIDGQISEDLVMMGYPVKEFENKQQHRGNNSNEESDDVSKNATYDVSNNTLNKRLKQFQQAEETGSEIQFRCVRCRGCKECKKSDCDQPVSIKEEIEQEIINQSVKINTMERQAYAFLPLIHNPEAKLAPNKSKALKTFKQQLKRINRNPEDKKAIMKAMKKLEELGFAVDVTDLSPEMQQKLKDSPIQNFLPWHVVWKDSISTPVRPVFNASQITDSGYSLNDILAKGINNMSKLVEMFIRWRGHRVAFHNDVQKMYNAIKLESDHWCFQRILWQDDLDPEEEPKEKIITTLIYGVKSSGNQAERALRLVGEMYSERYPDVHEIITSSIYVDDVISGTSSEDLANRVIDELELVLNKGGFSLKGYTISGRDPDEALTTDGISITVAGQRWYSKEDLFSIDLKTLNFAKKNSGRKINKMNEIPQKLTRRMCTSKVAEIFDITGMLTPIIATLKLDIHDLVIKGFDWDETLPENLRSIWVSHFEMMQEIKSVRFHRAIIPIDAVDLNVNTLDFGDASKELVCAAIYARFKRKCGKFSCQLVFARSRLVPKGMTQPRAELYAAVINTHSGETVRRAFHKTHQGAIKFTDSTIALHWISNERLSLEQWVRTRSIEINRFTKASSWRYVQSSDMIADLGTRRCEELNKVNNTSTWINGHAWMKEEESKFPMLSVEEIKEEARQSHPENEEAKFEELYLSGEDRSGKHQIQQRYEYSNYLIDPNRHSFSRVVRTLSIVIHFIKTIRERIALKKQGQLKTYSQYSQILISEEELTEAKSYFFRKASDEVKKFLKESQYANISREVKGILTYTGRILSNDSVSIVGQATNVMKDLCATTFCVPVADKYSPVAFSVVSDIHWNDPSVLHTGVESTWRTVLKHLYIIEGRSLVWKIRTTCPRCRYLSKKALDVAMGPISPHNITIAPAFYVTQMDLAGPFLSYSYHNKRATVKIWIAVFCCCTTSATKLKVMDGYDTSAFMQAFIRFSCEVGYPSRVLIDSGKQVIKACDSSVLNFRDIQFKLHKEYGVKMELCPVSGHNFHGKVERKILQVKLSLQKTMTSHRLSIMQWETMACSVANNINNLPLAIGNAKGNFESMDLITPNRLLLGRNNNRAPTETFEMTGRYEKIIAENQAIFNAWFENWLLSHVPKLMPQPKWFRQDRDLKEGDVVLFLKDDSKFSSEYQYGMVESVSKSRDNKIRKVEVKYRNANEQTDRFTFRAVRSLVMIHPVDEINLMQEIGEIARQVDNEKRKETLTHE